MTPAGHREAPEALLGKSIEGASRLAKWDSSLFPPEQTTELVPASSAWKAVPPLGAACLKRSQRSIADTSGKQHPVFT